LAIQAARFEQVLRVGDIELRIGAQEVQERRQIALEAGLRLHLLHLRANLRDLIEGRSGGSPRASG
jgi:hypothetical protein